MSSRTDRRPRQRLDTQQRREAILAAAGRLYAVAPYAEVSVAQIAEAAQASPALVFHYFGSKAELFAAVVAASIEQLRTEQTAADAALSPGVPARDRVRASLLVYLDHIADHPAAWAAPFGGAGEPAEAVRIRHAARTGYVRALADLLPPDTVRHEYALWGYFGFLDQACLRWVDLGCPDEQRHSLVDAALGALEGALGDWGR
ncbi:TetR family transcriptional regulator [Propionicimonas paludicola]|uniref:TetR family transcriptional regulator n=1 Tax=Propionicimonas paludicola TaxID=185243 RepID=A0A2A9CTU5_9ACTN|nr:TetR/AcrR family transcriptional regulator [Propionicimonas paludicola]PFG17072.1 TetR family transcriptional regulator [Propionicimonas paludicola]